MTTGHEWAIRSVKGFACALALTLTLSLGTVVAQAAAQQAAATKQSANKKKKSTPKACKKKKGQKKLSKKQKKACAKAKAKAKALAKAKAEAAAKAKQAAAATPAPTPGPAPPVEPRSTGLTVSSNSVSPADDDAPGFPNRLVFSTFAVQDRAGHSVSLRNATGSPVTVTGLSFGGASPTQFELCSAAPTTIANGATANVCVAFRPSPPSSRRVVTATLNIATNESVGGYTVELRGLNTGQSASEVEGYDEASLQNVFDGFGYNTNAGVRPGQQQGNPGNGLFISTTPAAQGDEEVVSGVGTRCAPNPVSPYYKALDPTKPVTLRPMARYSGISNGGTSPYYGWYGKGSPTGSGLHDMFALPNGTGVGGPGEAATEAGYGQNQKLLPTIANGGQTTFNPSGSFGIYARYAISTSPSNPTGVAYSDDALNPDYFDVPCARMFRAYPAKDAGGAKIPGVYLVGQDNGAPTSPTKTWDYQDMVFMLINAVPENS